MFHAQLGSDRVFEGGSIIIFDSVITNLGGPYAPSVGVFLCPVSGHYFFAVSLVSNTYRGHASIMIVMIVMIVMIDNTNKQTGPLTSTATDTLTRSGMSTQTLITECQVGSIVYVQAQVYSSGYPAANIIAGYNTFSGFLLYETE